MRKPRSVQAVTEFGRVRLSENFFMREFLHSEIADFHGIPNIPEDPDLAVAAGRHLCEALLEPLHRSFGKVWVRSGYRAPAVNGYGNARQREGKTGYPCGSNEMGRARHIWDRRDARGCMGATACIVLPWFADRYAGGADWRALAWWIHDHLPYSEQQFFPRYCALNLTWSEAPRRRIDSYIAPRGCLTRPGMDNHDGSHSDWYEGFPAAA